MTTKLVGEAQLRVFGDVTKRPTVVPGNCLIGTLKPDLVIWSVERYDDTTILTFNKPFVLRGAGFDPWGTPRFNVEATT